MPRRKIEEIPPAFDREENRKRAAARYERMGMEVPEKFRDPISEPASSGPNRDANG